MALIYPNRYPGRWDPTSAQYPQGKFKNRSSPTAKDGSFCEMDWANDWAGFFGAMLKNAGVTPNGSIDTATASQLYDALRVVTGGKYGTALIGSLVHWPLQQMPQEIFTGLGQVYIPYIAQAFDKSRYPLLGMLHPSGVLPADMRGEFARGWDNGRGVDSARVLMSAQSDAARPITGTFLGVEAAYMTGAFYAGNKEGSMQAGITPRNIFNFDSTRSNPSNTADENRSRNIAWNMIVRAA